MILRGWKRWKGQGHQISIDQGEWDKDCDLTDHLVRGLRELRELRELKELKRLWGIRCFCLRLFL